jgi:hypothetical protein
VSGQDTCARHPDVKINRKRSTTSRLNLFSTTLLSTVVVPHFVLLLLPPNALEDATHTS